MPTLEQTRKIHAMKREIGMTEKDYRDHLRGKFQVASSTDLDEGQAGELIDDLRQAGAGNFRSPARTASGAYSKVLQALWISAWQLGVVASRDDRAMLKFVERQTGLSHTRFLNDSAEAAKAIEGLKAWIAREAGIVWPSAKRARELGTDVAWLAGREVVRAQMRRLIGLGAWPGGNDDVLSEHLANFARVNVGIAGDFNSYGVAQWRRLADALAKRLRPSLIQEQRP
jgi:hypothetical protein